MESIKGVQKELSYPVKSPCTECKGQGGFDQKKCARCKGRGVVRLFYSFFNF